ncbi:MAG TPA: STAS domain-containing protein [Anaerolineales bacterium]|nr:STAS domain-containing protein [Anaerolineales bacterium]
MNITVTQHLTPPVTVFSVEGRIHLGNAFELRERAKEEHDRGMNNLVLDLSGVQSLTSEGLRSIHFIYKLLQPENSPEDSEQKSAHVKLLNPSSDIRRILNLAGFDLFLEIYDQLPDAIASF